MQFELVARHAWVRAVVAIGRAQDVVSWGKHLHARCRCAKGDAGAKPLESLARSADHSVYRGMGKYARVGRYGTHASAARIAGENDQAFRSGHVNRRAQDAACIIELIIRNDRIGLCA